MKCLNCGKTVATFLCTDCQTQENLNKIFYEILYYRPENCENAYLAEYISTLTEKYAERNIIPSILDLFDFDISEFYYCKYYKICKDPRFEDAAIAYMQTHELADKRTQNILYSLIDTYIPNNFI
jgi:hypothetical protein